MKKLFENFNLLVNSIFNLVKVLILIGVIYLSFKGSYSIYKWFIPESNILASINDSEVVISIDDRYQTNTKSYLQRVQEYFNKDTEYSRIKHHKNKIYIILDGSNQNIQKELIANLCKVYSEKYVYEIDLNKRRALEVLKNTYCNYIKIDI